ncbi:MAG: hypothetical protein V9G19_03710 [Tetrasphaera sp.]
MPTPTSPRRARGRAALTLPAALVVPLAAGAASAGAGPTATEPTVHVRTPTAGAQLRDGTVRVTGSYSSDQPVTRVSVVLCRTDAQQRCRDYLTSATAGTFATGWTALKAALTPDSSTGGRTGSFALTATNLPTATMRAATYASDAETPKGPRMSVDFGVTASSNPPGPGYITIMWGRAGWQAAGGEGCSRRPANARTLEQNAKDLLARGLFGVGGVVTSRANETTRQCTRNYVLESSWADLARLRDRYGWSVISQSKTYPDLTTLDTEAEVLAETRDTLATFRSHGHARAWGAFAYPDNKRNGFVQAIVNRYFAFGRIYGDGINSRAEVTQPPHWMTTLSVNGGQCHNEALDCHTMTGVNNQRTTVPAVISRSLRPGADQWGVVQFYRIVDGKYGVGVGSGLRWDCTSSDWRNRWTGQPELYCRNSFLEALAGRSSSARIADPVTVAKAWGRRPG